jgi:BirA family transcriptional regulator, biotin operon repressor / biotin---[acetyl-CoA-carboxylase] ligase
VTEAPHRLHTWHGAATEEWRRRWELPRLRIYRSVGSTNTLALRLAARGAPAGTTVVADHQTAGRGRRGAAWHAPAGAALLLSMVLRPAAGEGRGAGPASIRVGLLAAAAVQAVAGLRTLVKWPNDLLAPDGRKLGGVLCEGAFGGGSAWLVVGIGINVNQQQRDFPPEITHAATSIAALRGAEADRAALAGALVRALAGTADIAAPLQPAEIRALRQRDALLGRALTLDGSAAGVATGIGPDGGLHVRSTAGSRILYNGTVRFHAGGPSDDLLAVSHSHGPEYG